MGSFGHFAKHGADLLPLRIQLAELRGSDVASVYCVI
jgi:hypothetical protein